MAADGIPTRHFDLRQKAHVMWSYTLNPKCKGPAWARRWKDRKEAEIERQAAELQKQADQIVDLKERCEHLGF